MNLDNYQQGFVNFNQPKNSILVLTAVAGSGKSTTLASKISKLMLSGVKPEQIIALTFTNASARDLKSKIRKSVSTDILPHCSTIHS